MSGSPSLAPWRGCKRSLVWSLFPTRARSTSSHFVPWLAKPIFLPWERGWNDPRFHCAAPTHEQPLYKEQPCYIFHQHCRLLEGMKQALWLTKTKLIEGLPKKVLSLVDDPTNHIENQEQCVLDIISHTSSGTPLRTSPRERLTARSLWTASCSCVRGPSSTMLSAKDPLPPIASREEVEATRSHVLETFHPISPTIDLQECHVYEVKNDTGFWEGYPYPHPHTLYILEKANLRPQRFLPEQLRAKMLLFAFTNALAQARLLYGNTARVLEQPIVVQRVGTDVCVFQFLVLELNTTDLASSEGVKNLVWTDSDQLLYQHFWCCPVIKIKVVMEPVGPVDFQPESFKKFLALYLHGAV